MQFKTAARQRLGARPFCMSFRMRPSEPDGSVWVEVLNEVEVDVGKDEGSFDPNIVKRAGLRPSAQDGGHNLIRAYGREDTVGNKGRSCFDDDRP